MARAPDPGFRSSKEFSAAMTGPTRVDPKLKAILKEGAPGMIDAVFTLRGGLDIRTSTVRRTGKVPRGATNDANRNKIHAEAVVDRVAKRIGVEPQAVDVKEKLGVVYITAPASLIDALSKQSRDFVAVMIDE